MAVKATTHHNDHHHRTRVGKPRARDLWSGRLLLYLRFLLLSAFRLSVALIYGGKSERIVEWGWCRGTDSHSHLLIMLKPFVVVVDGGGGPHLGRKVSLFHFN